MSDRPPTRRTGSRRGSYVLARREPGRTHAGLAAGTNGHTNRRTRRAVTFNVPPGVSRIPRSGQSSTAYSALQGLFDDRDQAHPFPDSRKFERYLSYEEMALKVEIESMYRGGFYEHVTRQIHQQNSEYDRFGAQNIYTPHSPLLPLGNPPRPRAMEMSEEFPWTTKERQGMMEVLEHVRSLRHPDSQDGGVTGTDFDAVLLSTMTDVKCPYFFSFAYRYCLADRLPLATLSQPSGGSADEQVTGDGLIDYGDQAPRLLTMEFLPALGALTERVPEIPYLSPFTTLEMVPMTEHIVLRSPDRSTFDVSDIKLALWPDIRGRGKVRCAVFLVNEMTPSLAKTWDHQMKYQMPKEPLIYLGSPKQPIDHLVSTPPIEPGEFHEFVPGCTPIIIRSRNRELNFPPTDRGLIGKFGPNSQINYNLRVDRDDPHLVPPTLKDPESSFSSLTFDVLRNMPPIKSEGSTTENVEDPDDVPFLVPNALVELDDLTTTLKFLDTVKTSMIVIKLWKSERSFDESMLRVIEVRGFEGPRVFRREVRPR